MLKSLAMPIFKVLFIIVVFMHPVLSHSDIRQQLTVSTDLATEGYVTLNWDDFEGDEVSVNLQVATDQSFQTLVRDLKLRGQKQVHLSGFTDGSYFVRLVDDERQLLTNEVSFQVKHRDLQMAWLLFAVGLVLFVLLLFSIIRFTHQNK